MDSRSVTLRRLERMRPNKNMGAKADRKRLEAAQLPPGPRLPQLAQTLGILRYRHTFVPWLRRRFGDTVTVRLIPGRRMVFLHRPADVKSIFTGDPDVLHAGKSNAILGPVMGQHSLLLVDGEDHRRTRRMLLPAFSNAALRTYGDMVTGIAKTEVGSWTPEVPFRSLDRMNALTLEVILQVVFGVTDEQRLARLRPAVTQLVDVGPTVLLGWGFPFLARFGQWRKAIGNMELLDDLIFTEIATRRASPDIADRTDVLSRLIAVRDEETGAELSDEELRDHLVTLLLAGHETTATALSWALYELGRNPEVLAKAQAAAASADDDYLEAALKESLRLHPVIAMVGRFLMQPATVAGIELPRGVAVAASILLAHSSEESFPDHQAFRPERFEGKVDLNAWIPFGGGVRRCIGAGFSLMEGVAVLREVLMSYDVETVAVEQTRVRNITSVPGNGGTIVVRAR